MSKADLTIDHTPIKENPMNAVGIDVSKNKSTVAILRPFGEIVTKPFDVKHTSSDITHLISQLKSLNGDTRIVMEHTGRYYEPMAQWLSDAGLFVSAVNPKLIKDFGNNSLRKVKTDKADAVKIARYTLDNWCDLKPYSNMDELRRQLKNMNRQFDFYMKQKTAMKNNLIALLDETFTGINTFFDSPARTDGSQKWVDFATTFWYVDCVHKQSISSFYQADLGPSHIRNVLRQVYMYKKKTEILALCPFLIALKFDFYKNYHQISSCFFLTLSIAQAKWVFPFLKQETPSRISSAAPL